MLKAWRGPFQPRLIRKDRFLALLTPDLAGMARSWLVRLWLALLVLSAAIPVLAAVPGEELASEILRGWLQLAIVPSAIVVIILSAAAVSSESGVVADSILSKAVTRYEYILAKLASRVVVVSAIYLAVTVPTAYLVARYAERDVTVTGVVLTILSLGAILIFLTTLGITFSSFLGNPFISMAILFVLVSVQSAIFQFLGIGYLSPSNVLKDIPSALTGELPAWDLVQVVLAFGLVSIGLAGVTMWAFGEKDV